MKTTPKGNEMKRIMKWDDFIHESELNERLSRVAEVWHAGLLDKNSLDINIRGGQLGQNLLDDMHRGMVLMSTNDPNTFLYADEDMELEIGDELSLNPTNTNLGGGHYATITDKIALKGNKNKISRFIKKHTKAGDVDLYRVDAVYT